MLMGDARKRAFGIAAAAGALLWLGAVPAGAQQPAQPPAAQKGDAAKGAPSNAAGIGSAWKAEVKESANTAGTTLDPKQLEAVKRIDTYFNDLHDMQGRFLQTTSDKKQTKGRFYVKRPGKFRFDYAPPSRLVILSDGNMLSIEDHDIKTQDKYPIESTPFRILLRKDVNIARDARIVDMAEAEDLLMLTLVDKAGESSGQIRLFFAKQPGLELKEWVITDAQGVDTRIEVAELDRTQRNELSLFRPSDIGRPQVGTTQTGQ
jgi:outer membrane lipoprotein-sorting protein